MKKIKFYLILPIAFLCFHGTFHYGVTAEEVYTFENFNANYEITDETHTLVKGIALKTARSKAAMKSLNGLNITMIKVVLRLQIFKEIRKYNDSKSNYR